ncbi:MAG: hypothetical protein PHW13_11320 [Methylococcales bacterium]|nr:hypothetical protein [Methylococcales bacterium]
MIKSSGWAKNSRILAEIEEIGGTHSILCSKMARNRLSLSAKIGHGNTGYIEHGKVFASSNFND